MSRTVALSLPLLAGLLAGANPSADGAEDLRTVAEKSSFRSTARHEDVMRLSRRLAAASDRVRLESLGRSVEGRDLPLLVVGMPPPADRGEIERSGRLAALLFGNIHAGEVCGKEALLMLTRELATAEDPGLLRHLVLLVVPILNADGNERMATDNRRNQIGPEEGAGVRHNAQGLDLNRDFVKLESPEVRALVSALTRWDPALVVDTHTTNGSRHRYVLTHSAPRNPAGDARVIELVRDRMLPEVGRSLEADRSWRTFPYGNFDRERSRWTTFPCWPRYSTNYVGLRGRLAVLSEAYAYASYENRVLATRDFVRACLSWTAEHRGEVRALLREVDTGVAGSPDGGDAPRIALRTRLVPAPGRRRVLGWEEEERDGRRVPTDRPRSYEVELIDRAEAVLETPLPGAWILPGRAAREPEPWARNLLLHGIRVEVLREDLELSVEVLRLDAVRRQSASFEKHHLAKVEASERAETRRIPAGSLVVRTSQPLGRLAAYLLDPRSEDGLCGWGLLDGSLEVGRDYPLLRVPTLPPARTARWGGDPGEDGERQRITFDLVYRDRRPPRLDGSPAGGQRWLPDGEHYEERLGSRLFKVHARSGRREELPRQRTAMADALRSLATVDDETAAGWGRARRLRTDPAGRGALFEHGGDLYWAALDGTAARRLTSSPAVEELATLSPDGAFVAFVRENDLWVVDVASGRERALTTGGTDTLRSGKASWVYFEEIFDRSWKAFWWSPDSRRIAFLRTDSSRVKEFTVVDNLPGRQRVERSTYPKPGEPNPLVRLGIVDVAGGSPVWVDLSGHDESDLLVSEVGWWPDGREVYLAVQNRIQSRLELCAAPVGGGPPRVLFREEPGAWVEDPEIVRFLADGSVIVSSDRNGWQHLYHHRRDGRLVRPITSGPWEVRRVHAIDEEAGWVWLTATRDSHTAENLYRVRLDGSSLERLTPEDGWHSPDVGPRGRYFVDRVSSHRSPTRVLLRSGDGKLVRTLDTNPVPDLERWVVCPVEMLEIPARDGFPLPASLMKPPDFDPEREYPVWFMTYGGPRAPSVRDTWSGGRIWDQVLAQSGIVVFRCDPRSASGRGAISAWSAYRRLGVQELADISDAIGWLTAHRWVDADRVGMSGHSYGGFMTAYAMTHSRLFSAGVAGAPVTDWRDYDTIYTERYMGTPQDNPSGYDETSVVRAARNLHGRLLLLHGEIDDNVHLQNTMRLVKALQDANRGFELMLYPGARHGIWSLHYRQLLYDFILEASGGPRTRL